MTPSQKILVTGAASGFGALISRTLVRNGHTVFSTMRDKDGRNASKAEALIAAARGMPGKLHALELDVTSEPSVEAAVGLALELEGGLDAVVNNAAIGLSGTFAEAVGMDQFQRVFDVNVAGVQRVTRAALPALRRSGGLILNVSSIMGRIVLPYAAVYTATKYALEGLSESYRYELAGVGVEVVLLQPGGFFTDFWTRMESPSDPERLKGYGPLADEPGKAYEGIAAALQGPDGPDPQLVADAALKVLETPRGSRPLRVVVDPLMGGKSPEAVNRHGTEVQAELFGALGMQGLLTLKSLD
jgi:NAD(P)-dependent dehydrogenase (short-subunit alcohol dehydrogenase family)